VADTKAGTAFEVSDRSLLALILMQRKRYAEASKINGNNRLALPGGYEEAPASGADAPPRTWRVRRSGMLPWAAI